MAESQWLLWARRLQALSQASLTYCTDPVDIERFKAVRQIAAEITASHSNLTVEELLALFDRDAGYATPKVAVRADVFQDVPYEGMGPGVRSAREAGVGATQLVRYR